MGQKLAHGSLGHAGFVFGLWGGIVALFEFVPPFLLPPPHPFIHTFPTVQLAVQLRHCCSCSPMSNVVQPARAYSSIMRTLGDIDRRDSDARIPCVDGNSSSRAASAAEETVIRRDGCNSNDSGGSDSAASTPPRTTSPPALPSNTNQTDIEMLQAENALLRLELAEAQEKLRVATTNVSGLSVRPIRSRSPSGEVVRSRSDKDAGNRGVACVQMRRLLLKDDRFLREEFLPFLNMDDFGRCVGCG